MFYLLKRVVSLSVMLSLVCVSLVHADASADLKEVHKFQLTEKRVDQYMQVLRNMAEAAEKNPEFAKQDDDDSADRNQSIDGMVARIEKFPPMKKAIESAGMSTRDFVLFQMALMSAAMGNYLVEQGHQLPPEFSAEHAKFYKQHEQKFKALEKEMKEIQKKLKPEESEEEAEEDSETEE